MTTTRRAKWLLGISRVLVLALAIGAGCRARQPPAPAASAPSFSRDVAPVLARMCAANRGCHGEAPTDSVDLDLRRASAYRQLVGQPAQARKGALRVKPGDASASFLVDKLTGALGPREGKPMPIDAQTGAPILPSPIDRAYVDAILAPWIAAGAPEN
ncbi:MAG TPA: hypothetical protein VFF06_23730 [Polyangia bacterium]|nr:hypothetical protein [Polyangia bacterium]